MRLVCLLIILTSLFFDLNAQNKNRAKSSNNSLKLNTSWDQHKQRKKILLISEFSSYVIALAGLNQLWYAGYPRSKFHFINDNQEWLQMDKMGHLTASYYTGVVGIKSYEWAGFTKQKAIWYGGMTGSIFLTIIEILDGTSKQWGASSGDLIANSTGSFLAILQAIKWNEQKIQLKYSYTPTKWAEINPKQLGANHLERALKDYNGQTYWASLNVKSLLNIESNNFPNWIAISIGYGADGMINPYSKNSDNTNRQYLLSFDIDLNRIETRSKMLNTILHTFGFLKFPAPTIELTKGNILFHPIYY